MKTKKVWLVCSKCGGNTFEIYKNIKYPHDWSWKRALRQELLSHEGIGWDMNTFEIRCAKCGSKDAEVVWDTGRSGFGKSKSVWDAVYEDYLLPWARKLEKRMKKGDRKWRS